MDRLDAAASALRHGLRPSFHSDYSVSPMSPLLAVQTAVTGSTRDGSVLNPAEGIDVMSALRAVTIDAAWQTHCDDVAGSLTRGKYADFVVLSMIRGRSIRRRSARSACARPGWRALSPGTRHDGWPGGGC